MARRRLCKQCGGWHELQAWPHNCLPVRNLARSHLPAPSIVSDTMDPTECHADGRVYDSKSEYYRAVDQSGCAIMEPGMEPAAKPVSDVSGKDIKTAIEQLEARL